MKGQLLELTYCFLNIEVYMNIDILNEKIERSIAFYYKKEHFKKTNHLRHEILDKYYNEHLEDPFFEDDGYHDEHDRAMNFYILTLNYLFIVEKDKFTDQEIFKVYYLIFRYLYYIEKIDSILLDEKFVMKTLMDGLLKYEKKPCMIDMGDHSVCLPYSLYALMAGACRFQGDTEEAYRWAQYGIDRISSFYSQESDLVKERIYDMLCKIFGFSENTHKIEGLGVSFKIFLGKTANIVKFPDVGK